MTAMRRISAKTSQKEGKNRRISSIKIGDYNLKTGEIFG